MVHHYNIKVPYNTLNIVIANLNESIRKLTNSSHTSRAEILYSYLLSIPWNAYGRLPHSEHVLTK